MKFFLTTLLLLAGVACDKGAFKQDPLAGEPDRVRNGTPPELRKPDNREACPTDALLIETFPDVAVFEEGVHGEMKILGRLLGCGQTYEIEVLNPPPGSNFDSATGMFSYVAPKYTVMSESYYVEKYLKLRMKTLEEPVVIKDRTLVYFVRRSSRTKPEIEKVEGLPNRINEGSEDFFQVYVRDEDSIGLHKELYPPRLRLVNNVEGKGNAIPFLRVNRPSEPIQDKNDPTLWVFSVSINIRDRGNVFSSNENVSFSMVATSRFGAISDSKTERFQIVNRVKDPTISWGDKSHPIQTMRKGEANNLVFFAYDPLKEGRVSAEIATDCSKFGGDISCKCFFVYPNEGTSCQISWLIPRELEGLENNRVTFEIEVKNQNPQDYADYKVVKFSRDIFLEEARIEEPSPIDDSPDVPEPPPEDEGDLPPPPPPEDDPSFFRKSKISKNGQGV